jgi:hypothetical protein
MDAALQAMLMMTALRMAVTSVRRRLAAFRAVLDGALGELLAD